MKKIALRLLSVCLMLALLVSGALAESVTGTDYTVAEKLIKQLQAGSGFAGTLTLESTAVAGRESEALTTLQPITLNFNYIYVRPDTATGTKAESRVTLSLAKDGGSDGKTQFSLREGIVYLTSALLGDDWYVLSPDLEVQGSAVTVAPTGTAAIKDNATPTDTAVITDTAATATETIAATPAPAASETPDATATDTPVEAETPAVETTANASAAATETIAPVATVTGTTPSIGSGDANGSFLSKSLNTLLDQTTMPGIAAFVFGLLGHLHDADTTQLSAALDPYTTKIDLWIEGYRQKAVLGKLTDGTTTMEVVYQIPASAVKAQLKQMLMDLLNDADLLALLQTMISAQDAERFLSPALQEYYFYAVDALPLDGTMEIDRTVSLKGKTIALTLALPLYDSLGGKATLRYNRHQGEKDLPDENTIELQSDQRLLKVAYQTYDTLTGTTVYDGTILRQSTAANGTNTETPQPSAQTAEKTFSAAFTLSTQQTSATSDDGKESLTSDVTLSLAPEYTPDDAQDEASAPTEAQAAQYVVFDPVELKLNTVFASGQAKNASTTLDATLEIAGDQLPEKVKITFSGKTKGKWTVDKVDTAKAIPLETLSESDALALLAQAGVKGGLLLMPYINLPQTQTTEAPAATVTATAAP